MRGFGAKAAVAVMVILLLSGCSYSLSQIRGYEPYQTLTSTKSPQELAKCIELQIRGTTGQVFDVNPSVALEEYPNHNYRVPLTLPGYGAIGDILVTPAEGGSVVEYRRRGPWMGQARVLEIIERCAK